MSERTMQTQVACECGYWSWLPQGGTLWYYSRDTREAWQEEVDPCWLHWSGRHEGAYDQTLDGEKFCPYCGTRLNADGSTTPMVPATTSEAVRGTTFAKLLAANAALGAHTYAPLRRALHALDLCNDDGTTSDQGHTILAALSAVPDAAAPAPTTLADRIRREVAAAGPMDWQQWLAMGRELFADAPATE